jgi:hypothetical protein
MHPCPAKSSLYKLLKVSQHSFLRQPMYLSLQMLLRSKGCNLWCTRRISVNKHGDLTSHSDFALKNAATNITETLHTTLQVRAGTGSHI